MLKCKTPHLTPQLRSEDYKSITQRLKVGTIRSYAYGEVKASVK